MAGQSDRSYSYLVVDVFTEVPLQGNPLGVFPDAEGLSDGEMQAIARELNLSETSFLFAPRDAANAARLRIFTPAREVDFAGHPTIGTAFALVTLGRIAAGVSNFVLEENIGPIPIALERREHPFLAWLRTPPVHFGKCFDPTASAAALGLTARDLLEDFPVQEAGAGNPFIYIPLRDRETVDRAELDARQIAALAPDGNANGVFVFTPSGQGVYARMFAPMSGIYEDPATGSATGPLGAYLLKYDLIERRDGLRFTSEQGTKMGRQSFVHVRLRIVNDVLETVEIGGSAVRVIEGRFSLPALSHAP